MSGCFLPQLEIAAVRNTRTVLQVPVNAKVPTVYTVCNSILPPAAALILRGSFALDMFSVHRMVYRLVHRQRPESRIGMLFLPQRNGNTLSKKANAAMQLYRNDSEQHRTVRPKICTQPERTLDHELWNYLQSSMMRRIWN